jgi:acyl-coenzyme A synthetase/AMP-(fatty) acid ligase
LGLDYVSEVMVVGVEDEEFGQRVAAAIVLKDRVSQSHFSGLQNYADNKRIILP